MSVFENSIKQKVTVLDSEGHIRKIAKESGIGVFGSLIGTGLSYLATIVGARFLGAGDYGIFVLARTVCEVAFMLAAFGVPKALDRFLPQFVSSGQLGKARQLIVTLTRYALISGLLTGVIVFLVGCFIKEGNQGLTISVMAVTIPLILLIELCVYVFSGFKELRYEVIIKRLIIPAVYILLGMAAIKLNFGLIGWVCSYVIANLIGLFFAGYYFQKKIWKWLKKEPPAVVEMDKVGRYFLPLGFSCVILFLISQINILFLGYYSTSKEVAIFSIYLSVLGILSMVRTSIGRIYKPVLAGMVSSHNQSTFKNDFQIIYSRATNWILLINVLGVLLILFYGNEFVKLIVGYQYIRSPLAFQILTISAFIDYASGLGFETLEATGNSRAIMSISLLMLVLSLILNPLLIPAYGILGATISYLIVFSIANILAAILVWKRYGLSPFDGNYFKMLLLFISLCTVVNCIGVYAVNAIIVAILLVVLYITGVFLTKTFNDDDLNLLKNAIKNCIKSQKIFTGTL